METGRKEQGERVCGEKEGDKGGEKGGGKGREKGRELTGTISIEQKEGRYTFTTRMLVKHVLVSCILQQS